MGPILFMCMGNMFSTYWTDVSYSMSLREFPQVISLKGFDTHSIGITTPNLRIIFRELLKDIFRYKFNLSLPK